MVVRAFLAGRCSHPTKTVCHMRLHASVSACGQGHRPLPDKWLADHPDAPFHTADSVEAGIALAKELAGDGGG